LLNTVVATLSDQVVLYQRSIERLERSRTKVEKQLKRAPNVVETFENYNEEDNAMDLEDVVPVPAIRHARSGSDTSAIKVFPDIKPKTNRSKSLGRLQTNLKDSWTANAERMFELKRFCRTTLDSITMVAGASKIRHKVSMEEHVEESENLLQLRQEFEELQNFARLIKQFPENANDANSEQSWKLRIEKAQKTAMDAANKMINQLFEQISLKNNQLEITRKMQNESTKFHYEFVNELQTIMSINAGKSRPSEKLQKIEALLKKQIEFGDKTNTAASVPISIIGRSWSLNRN